MRKRVDETDTSVLFKRIGLAACLVTVFFSLAGLAGHLTGMSFLSETFSSYKPMAISTAVFLFFFALVTISLIYRPVTGLFRSGIGAVLGIAAIFGLLGSLRYIFDMGANFMVGAGSMSYLTGIISFLFGMGLFIILYANYPGNMVKKSRSMAGIIVSITALAAFTVFLGYFYGQPFFGMKSVPMAFTTTISFFFLGIGFIIANGKKYIPGKAFMADTTRARLIRVFIPLTVLMLSAQEIIAILLYRNAGLHHAVYINLMIFFFFSVTLLIVIWVATFIGKRIDSAEKEKIDIAKFPSENPDPVLRVTTEGLILYINPAAGRVLEEYASGVGQQLPDEWRKNISEVLKPGKRGVLEKKVGGRIYSFEIVPMTGEGYINLYGKDITEVRKTGEALLRQTVLLTEMGKIAKVGGWELDLTRGGTATWTKGAYDILELGYDKPVPGLNEFIGYHTPEFRGMVKEKIMKAKDNRESFQYEAKVTVNGKMKWGRVIGNPVVKEGEVTGILGIFQDITEEKKGLESLQNTCAVLADREARLRTKLNLISAHETEIEGKVSLADLIDMEDMQKIQDAFSEATGVSSVVIGLEGQMVNRPSNFCEVCRLIRTTEEGRGRCSVSDLQLGERSVKTFKPEQHECLSCGFTDASAPIIVGGKVIAYWFIGQSHVGKVDVQRISEYAVEIGADKEAMVKAFEEMPKISAEQFQKALNLLWSLAGVISAQGYNNLLLTKDAALLRERENELEDHKAHLVEIVNKRTYDLKEANKELEAFSYSVSHDLRAPLRSMSGFSQLILEKHAEKLEPKAKDYLKRVCRAAERMETLIESLLLLSRVSRKKVKKEKIEISLLAEEVFSELREEDPERRVEAIVEPGIIAEGDKDLMRIVLRNLLSNAWKFTEKNPEARITFGVNCPQNECRYFVNDNGAGFDEQYKEKLFTAFNRLHSENEFPGIGIGLATVKRIITKHGGRVWAEGRPGEGATFYFALPK